MLIILIFKMASSVLKRKCVGEGSNHVSWKTGGKLVQVTLGPLPKQQQQVIQEDTRITQATAGLSQEQTHGVSSGFRMGQRRGDVFNHICARQSMNGTSLFSNFS